MKRSPWRHFKNKWFIMGAAIVAIVGLVLWRNGQPQPPKFDAAVAVTGDVVETVSVTGTIMPMDKADLAFQKSGAVAAVYVRVGDPVKKGDRLAMLDDRNDRAALAATQATHDDAARALTPQELAVQQTALDNAKKDAVNAAHDGFTKAQSALFNYTDGFYSNPQSSNPTLSIHTDTYNTQLIMNKGRLDATDALNHWSADLSAKDIDPTTLISKARGYASAIKSFMADLSVIVNALSPNNSSLSQAAINAYVASMNSGLTALNAAIDAISAAQASLSAAKSNYDLKLSGSSSQSIAALSAKVSQAQAALDQDVLVSPIAGIVAKADPNVGEFVSAGQGAFTVQNSAFKIEAHVPEADIAKISFGDAASSTLDAYGSDLDFPAQVSSIDPAEIVLEGVPTYKVTFLFVNPDNRIRSGMTANLDIHTRERHGVLTVPYRAVTDTKGSKTVRLVSADGLSFVPVPVTVGLKGSDGLIEILSGISEGDRVVTYVK